MFIEFNLFLLNILNNLTLLSLKISKFSMYGQLIIVFLFQFYQHYLFENPSSKTMKKYFFSLGSINRFESEKNCCFESK